MRGRGRTMQPDYLEVAQAGITNGLAPALTDQSLESGKPKKAGQPSSLRPKSNDRLSELLRRIQAKIGDRNFGHWFADRTTLTLDDNTLRVGVAGSFLLNWMQKRFAVSLLEAMRQAVPGGSIEWFVDPQAGALPLPNEEVPSETQASLEASQDQAASNPQLTVSPGTVASNSNVSATRVADSCSPATSSVSTRGAQETRRFRNLTEFVTGPGSQLATTAAQQVSQQPGERYSPLFLHGGVGTGKTHLAEGVYREIRRLHPQLRAVFMTSEQFTNQFTSALRSHTLPAFRQRFRSVDVLIVDDIGFLGGKRVIQEEFLHTIKQLESHGRQLVVTCDTHPRLMTGASEELVSRLLCGLVCRLESPDESTRRKIAESKAIQFGADFDEATLDYVARRFVTSVREIEGAITTLKTWQTMTDRPVTVAVARQVLADLERDCAKVVNLAAIEAAVSQLFSLQQKDLKSTRRTKAVTQPRMLAMFLARRHTQSAYKEIGDFFGGRNHSTVIAAEKKVEAWLDSDEELKIAGRVWKASDVIETLDQQLIAG